MTSSSNITRQDGPPSSGTPASDVVIDTVKGAKNPPSKAQIASNTTVNATRNATSNATKNATVNATTNATSLKINKGNSFTQLSTSTKQKDDLDESQTSDVILDVLNKVNGGKVHATKQLNEKSKQSSDKKQDKKEAPVTKAQDKSKK